MTASVPSDLDVYDIAYLAGGPARVVDTALVALVQTGRVRVHSPGRLATVDLARRHPVEAAVLDAIGPAGTARSTRSSGGSPTTSGSSTSGPTAPGGAAPPGSWLGAASRS